MTKLNDEFDGLLKQLTFDPDPAGIEFRYRCDDPEEGFRIALTERQNIDVFDIPYLAFERPTVFQVDTSWPGGTLHGLIRFLVDTAAETERELLAEKPRRHC